MSSSLDEFLGLQDVSDVRESYKFAVNGKVYEFLLRPVSPEEHAEYQKTANVIKGKSISFDLNKYNKVLLSNHIVEPNFSDAEFLKKVKCQTAYDFLSRKFTAGVITDIASKIQEISGFQSISLDVEEAKN